MGNRIANIVGMIVIVAMITAVVSRRNSAAIIRAFGQAFSSSIRSALGNS
jgi:hypothetical protein